MPSRLLYQELVKASRDLGRQLDRLYEEALGIWREPSLRQFTVHGRDHIDQVERNLDALTRSLVGTAKELRPDEIFVLLAACYLHDIGMQLGVPDARERHAEYSYQLILGNEIETEGGPLRVTLSLHDRNARNAIAAIARAHWTEHALQLDRSEVLYGNNDPGRLRLLGHLLAMADLLDVSPLRAHYLRSPHRLYALGIESELHHTMHALVKSCRIESPDPGIPEDLQFRLEWHDRSPCVRDLSAWLLQWFSSQWRQLWPVLYAETGGAIRWTQPWARIRFREPVGSLPQLSPAAQRWLQADLLEQRRIDRDEFAQTFKQALEAGDSRPMLFLLPFDADLDGREVGRWCDATARRRENVRVARVSLPAAAPYDVPSLVAQLLDQWGEHLPPGGAEAALVRFRTFLDSGPEVTTVVILGVEAYEPSLVEPILNAFLSRAMGRGRRICVLLSQGAQGPASTSFAVVRPSWPAVPEEALSAYLCNRWGRSEEEGERLASQAASYRLLERPSTLYEFVRHTCMDWKVEAAGSPSIQAGV